LIKLVCKACKLPSFHIPVSRKIPIVDAQDVGEVAAAILASPPSKNSVLHIEGPHNNGTEEIAGFPSDLLGVLITAVTLDRAAGHPTLAVRTTASYGELLCRLFDALN
jgi:uncharacterized protein YbjT (DUF2867 family)